MGKLENLRKEIAEKGSYASTRSNAFTSEEPCEWSPYQITNPITGMFFTDASAWSLICDLLRSDHIFTLKTLDFPPGSEALETFHRLPDGTLIYIKVQLLKGRARGRSFHYPKREVK